MLDSIEDYEWKEVDRTAYEKTYINMDRDILYIEDRFNRQTEISDWHEDRYAVKNRKNYQPPETDDKILHETTDWEEAEGFLEAKAGDFQE